MLRPCLAACVLLLLPARALADTLQVPKDFTTIQEAVDASNDGDTILVHAGTYAEAVLITDKTDLVLKAAGKVIVDPPGSSDGITLDGCNTCTVEKLRVTDAVNGVRLVDGFTCAILKCRIEQVSGLGVALENCNNCTVEKCVIDGAGTDGIGLGAGGTPPCQLGHIRKNKIFAPGDDGIDVSGSNSIIEKNLVVDAGGNGYRSEHTPASATTTFLKCKSVGSQHNGFDINGSGHSIFFCTDVESVSNSLACLLGTGTYQILKLKSTKPGGDGILLEAGLVGSSITSCKVKAPAADGFHIEADTAVLSKN